jgi:excisionase family DNA binding protein
MKLTDTTTCLEEYARHYPPLITSEQAARIAQVPVATVYDWSSRGLFDSFKTKRGRRIRLNRDAFVQFLASN